MSILIYAYIATVIGGLSRNKYAHHFLILLLSYFFSTRNVNVPDTENYIFHYENSLVELVDMSGDIGMVALNYLCNNILHLPFSSFLFALTFLLMEIFYFTTRRILPTQHAGLLFLLFMSFYGFFYLGIVIRNGAALMLCYLAISVLMTGEKKRLLKFMGILTSATLFHKSSLLLLPIIFFANMKVTYNRALLWFLLSVVFIGIGSVSIVSSGLKLIEDVDAYSYDRYSSYAEDSSTKLLTATFIMDMAITIIAIWGIRFVRSEKRRAYDLVLKVILLGFSVYCLLWQLPGISRIVGMYFFVSSLAFYYLVYWNKNRTNDGFKKSATILISLAFFISLVIIQKYILYY